jgi:hypothetical protein
MSKVFRCDWPDGSKSFVFAKDVSEAQWLLDEEDGAEKDWLVELDSFQVHFGPTLGFEHFGEETDIGEEDGA